MHKKITCLIIALIVVGCAKPIHKKQFIIAGTYLNVTSPDPRAARIVYEEFRRLDKVFNLYDENSELSRLNKSYGKPFKVTDELFELLQLSRGIYDLSSGAFDVTHGTLYKFWKDLIRDGQVEEFPSSEAIAKIKQSGGMEAIEINPQERTVTIKEQGVIIDLSGIAKGYMVDKAVARLKQEGINSALINAGGDIYCLGINGEVPWKVGIQDPELPSGIFETELLIDEAIATSGIYRQFFNFEGKEYSHLIDPRSGYPVDNQLIGVSVITKNCTTADGLATAFSILGLEGVNKFLSVHPSTMRVVLITREGGKKRVYIFK